MTILFIVLLFSVVDSCHLSEDLVNSLCTCVVSYGLMIS